MSSYIVGISTWKMLALNIILVTAKNKIVAVHLFSSDWNTSAAIQWIARHTDMHGPQRMNPSDVLIP